jgi:hypothetical protein
MPKNAPLTRNQLLARIYTPHNATPVALALAAARDKAQGK